MDGNRSGARARHATLVIVGAGFSGTAVEEAFDRVINCSGPADDLARSASPLVEALLRAGLLTQCPTGIGVRLDAVGGRSVDRASRRGASTT